MIGHRKKSPISSSLYLLVYVSTRLVVYDSISYSLEKMLVSVGTVVGVPGNFRHNCKQKQQQILNRNIKKHTYACIGMCAFLLYMNVIVCKCTTICILKTLVPYVRTHDFCYVSWWHCFVYTHLLTSWYFNMAAKYTSYLKTIWQFKSTFSEVSVQNNCNVGSSLENDIIIAPAWTTETNISTSFDHQ